MLLAGGDGSDVASCAQWLRVRVRVRVRVRIKVRVKVRIRSRVKVRVRVRNTTQPHIKPVCIERILPQNNN